MRLFDFTSGGTMTTLFDEPRQQPDDPLVQSLRLSLIPGVGPLTRRALLERFGTPEAVFRAAPAELRCVHGVGPKLMRSIVAAPDEIDPETEIALCRENNIAILTEADEGYPRMLREIHDPPGVLFVRGKLLAQDALAVAIVGTRHATQYGLRQAEILAGSLARAGLTIVSGLARGIDAAAHRGALAAGGRTIAVLASGVLNVYPPEHKQLADEVIAHGALMSESPPRFAPLSGAFPQRNRLISGLTLGTIVVEAPDRSGALITARLAAEQDREVFAVPGRVDLRTTRGCHRLIRDGATLVETADDVLEQLGPLVQATPREDGQVVHHPAELLLEEPERKVLAAIDGEATQVDQIVVATDMTVAQVLSTLSVLEMRRLIRRLSGATVARI
jgi:DNA processing protein